MRAYTIILSLGLSLSVVSLDAQQPSVGTEAPELPNHRDLDPAVFQPTTPIEGQRLNVLSPDRYHNYHRLAGTDLFPEIHEDPDDYPGRFEDLARQNAGLKELEVWPHNWTFKPFFNVASKYDSNINFERQNQKADFYETIELGFESFLGSFDSPYRKPEEIRYDTITSLYTNYKFSTDIFHRYQGFDAVENKLILEGRIGRTAVIVRPYVTAFDETSEDKEAVERNDRYRTRSLTVGVKGENQLSPLLKHQYDFSWNQTDYQDHSFIDVDHYRATQELIYTLLPQKGNEKVFSLDLIAWGAVLQGRPDQGPVVNEIKGGAGFKVWWDNRFLTEVRVGWDEMKSEHRPEGWNDPSGIRFEGVTRYYHSDRLQVVFGYERYYEFSRSEIGNNYLTNRMALTFPIFLGDRWYFTPGIVTYISESETTSQRTFVWNPRVEVAYALGRNRKVFVRGDYLQSDIIKGGGRSVDAVRQTVGFNYEF